MRDGFGQFPVSIRALLMVEARDVDMNLQFLVKSQGIRAILLVPVANFSRIRISAQIPLVQVAGLLWLLQVSAQSSRFRSQISCEILGYPHNPLGSGCRFLVLS